MAEPRFNAWWQLSSTNDLNQKPQIRFRTKKNLSAGNLNIFFDRPLLWSNFCDFFSFFSEALNDYLVRSELGLKRARQFWESGLLSSSSCWSLASLEWPIKPERTLKGPWIKHLTRHFEPRKALPKSSWLRLKSPTIFWVLGLSSSSCTTVEPSKP